MSARSSTKSQLPATKNGADENPSAAAKVLSQIIERGARVQGPAVKAYVDRLRQYNPNATPTDVVKKLEKHYLAAVMASGAWLSDGAATLPLPAVSQLNSRLLRHFVKRYTLKRGAIAFGKLLPVGIGAVVGGVGNRMMGKKIVANARMAFGNPPPRWPASLHVLPAPGER